MMQDILEERATILGELDELIIKSKLMQEKINRAIEMDQPLEDFDDCENLVVKYAEELRTYERKLNRINKELGEFNGINQL